MASFLVLEDFLAAGIRLTAGTVLDDALHDVSSLQLSGLAAVPYDASMARIVTAYMGQRRQDPEELLGDLASLLLASPAGASVVGGRGALFASTTRQAFVSNAGNDTTGDGSRTRPYATVQRAVLDAPLYQASGAGFRVSIVAPYSGPGFNWNMLSGSSVAAAGAASSPFVVEAFMDTANPLSGTPTDPRWTVIKGPLTPTAATTEHGRPLYTFGAGTFPIADDDLCRSVRVFSSLGVEKFRGVVAHQRGAGIEQLVVGTRTGFSAPAITDQVYIVKPAVRITEAVTIGGLAPRSSLWFANIELGQSLTLAHVGLLNMNGTEVRRVDGSVTQAVTASGYLAALATPGLASNTAIGLGNLYPAAEALLLQSHVASLYNSAAAGRALFWSADSLTFGFVARGSVILTRGNFCATGGTAAGVFRRNGLLVEHSWVNILSVAGMHPVFTDCVTAMDFGGGSTISAGSAHQIVVDTATVTGRALLSRQTSNLDSGAGVALKFTPRDAAAPTLAGGVVAEAKQFASLVLDTTSALLGTGGDAKAGDNAAVTWAALAGAPSTDTTRLATVRATA